MEFNIGDQIEGVGTITRLSEHSIWIDNKRFRRSTIEDKKPLNMISKESRDVDIDWSNEQEVDKYYKSFVSWQCVLRQGNSKSCVMLKVKNNKVFHEGEYYLPYYHLYDGVSSKVVPKVFLEDCDIFGFVIKMKNRHYESMTNGAPITVNVFYIARIVERKETQYAEARMEARKNMSEIEFLKWINLNAINSKDLDGLRNKLNKLFDVKFPYIVNKGKLRKEVTFSFGDFNRIEVRHRNRTGYLRINNGYKGLSPYGLDYYAILEVSPHFTNECRYTDSVRVEKNFKFNEETLDKLAALIIPVWDQAIENNARLIR